MNSDKTHNILDWLTIPLIPEIFVQIGQIVTEFYQIFPHLNE